MKKLSFVTATVLLLCLVLTACQPLTFTVTFDAQNGTQPQTVAFDDNFTLPAQPTNGDKQFLGWFTDKQGTTPWSVPESLSQNVVVYAKWGEPQTAYYVIFHPQNGDESTVVRFDDNFALPAQPTNGSMVFGGWYADSACTIPWSVPQSLSGNVDVYAKWSNPAISEDADLSDVFAQYEDASLYNFKVQYTLYYEGEVSYSDTLKMYGDDVAMTYEYEGAWYTDYLEYRADLNGYFYYYDNGGGNYTVIDQTDAYFMDYYYSMDYVNVQGLGSLKFVTDGDGYAAADANAAGNLIFGEYEDSTWTSLALYVEQGKIAKIVAEQSDASAEYGGSYLFVAEFSDYGNASFTLPDDGSGGTGGEDVEPATDMKSVFTDNRLTVAAGQLGYTTDAVSNGFDGNRGVQFLQRNGAVTIVSEASVTEVTVVSVIVATNCSTGMTVQVFVGSAALECDGQTEVMVAQQTHFSENTTLNFVPDGQASGLVTIVLTPTNTEKSMYISAVAINGKLGGGGEGNVMPSQSYDEQTFDNSRLQDKLMGYENVVGLPSQGTFDCLVVPVQFSDTAAITSADLNKLNLAFNGSGGDTGWQSVNTYYSASSYGKLNVSFDIAGYNLAGVNSVYTAQHNSAYYANYNETVSDGDYQYTEYGSDALLREVLAWLEGRIDLTQYDSNGDGCIDAVYLIYSADVDYSADSFYWAYVTWYMGAEQYDGLDAYYYLFAGFDFMDEDADSADGFEYNGKIDGLQINASTYIHETGHLLGLDDYYDYYPNSGSDEGVGGADMMDYTVGDHSAYSKIMLGWTTPQIVAQDGTFTLYPFAESGDCLLIMLNFDNSYFSEYLLIDFYTATGLNQMHAMQPDSLLYGGAQKGVRIYHVTGWANNPYSDEYGSFTDSNNSLTSEPLLKLVEADGETKFRSTNGYAAASDLWQAGGSLSAVFNYCRNDGKAVNFDVKVESITNQSATVTVTFVD